MHFPNLFFSSSSSTEPLGIFVMFQGGRRMLELFEPVWTLLVSSHLRQNKYMPVGR